MDGRMKSGIRRVGAATCMIRQSDAFPDHLKAGIREISRLQTHHTSQNKGYATSLVHQICREADHDRIVLVLWPNPFGDSISLSRTQLQEWYEREFGFTAIQHDPLLMARQPQAVKPVTLAALEAIR
jgi:hypothetical protein